MKRHYEDPNKSNNSYCGIDIMAIIQLQNEDDEPCLRCLKVIEARGIEI